MEYVSFDVDGIKKYIFSSYRPSFVHAGSELIKRAIDYILPKNIEGDVIKKIKSEFSNVDVIFSCGGSGLLRVPDRIGEDVSNRIEKLYSESVPGSSLTSVWLKSNGDFQQTLKSLSLLLRLKKQRKALSESYQSLNGDFTKRCTLCGFGEPKNQIKIGDNTEVICDVCEKKYLEKGEFPHNIEDIPFDKEKQPYISLIYCDINNAGQIIFACENEEELRDISQNIYTFIANFIDGVKNKLKRNNRYHFIAPIIGGDDIVLLIPAEFTVEILEDLNEALKEINSRLKKPISFSISFVVSHYHTSIYYLFKIAERLLRSAKTEYYTNKKPGINFQWLKGSELAFSSRDTKVIPGNRPMALNSFYNICETTRSIIKKEISPSYLYKLLHIASSEKSEAYKKINLFYYVMKNDEMREIVLNDKKSDSIKEVYQFFIESKELGTIKYNKFYDIIEIYKLLNLGERRES